MPVWEQRFRAPAISFPTWARDVPDRLVLSSNESGVWQVYAWDRAAGTRRRVTDEPIGVRGGVCTPDGEGIVWFLDATGDEVGHWVIEPFAPEGAVAPAPGSGPGSGPGAGPGPGRARRSLLPDVADAWSAGLALGDGIVVAGIAGEDGFSVVVSHRGGPARFVHHHSELVEVDSLSRDSRLFCVEHAEHGDTMHLALRVIDALSGEVAGDEYDGPGFGLSAAGWSPVTGDQRMALVHELDGKERPAIWDITRDERQNLEVDLPGDVSVAGWWPDASALLVIHDHEGRHQLFRLDIEARAGGTGSGVSRLTVIEHPPGTISGAGVRPDGEVWYRISSGAVPPAVCAAGGAEVCAPEGHRAPGGRPYRSWWFNNPDGQAVHQFVVTPEAGGPHPVVMLAHGGPTWAYTDSFDPYVQAWVDSGMAVAMVNYRGSTGYGVEFRDALIGNPGFPEVEDVVAGLDALVAAGVADPDRVVMAGGSWGGYITLLAIGLQPQRWAAAVAAVPVADYAAAFEDEAPSLQSFDRSLFGGGPDEVPDLYKERSPLTYLDQVTAPVLVIAGDNDSRCPIRQVLNYVEALRARGGDVELYRFDAGHGSMVIDERVRQMNAELSFISPRVLREPGLPA